DAEPGPARALDAQRADALAQRVVRRWAMGVDGLDPADGHAGPAMPISEAEAARVVRAVTWRHRMRMIPWKTAAAVVLSLSVGSGACAALRVWQEREHEAAAQAAAAAQLTKSKAKHRTSVTRVDPAVQPVMPAAAAQPDPAAEPEPVALPGAVASAH